MKELGKVPKCMVLVLINSRVEVFIKANLNMARDMIKVFTYLKKVISMKENGKMINIMAKVG